MEVELPVPISFEWDDGNINKNLKHNVLAARIQQVFFNKPLIFLPGSRHSDRKRKKIFSAWQNKYRQRIINCIY